MTRVRAFVELHERLNVAGNTVTVKFWTRDQSLTAVEHQGATITVTGPDGIADLTDQGMGAEGQGLSIYHHVTADLDPQGEYMVECKGLVDPEGTGTPFAEKAVAWFEIHPRKEPRHLI